MSKKNLNLLTKEKHMKLINDLLNVDGLDLLTKEEKTFNTKFVKALHSYADGKYDVTKIKTLTAGASTIAKRQQSRSAVAMLKWHIAKNDQALPAPQEK